ncbi:MAG: hypothetical protein CL678_10435 [Bdellovibrionaceae bacterium]|nr:hypothetical protein [Pseudobdellovibrionaceae bacterium]|tara:strand:- start:2035 stop:3405 length:1371 start_codon:yes stop_codon:yes gene_type:complete
MRNDAKLSIIKILAFLSGSYFISAGIYSYVEYKNIERIKLNWNKYIEKIDKKNELISNLKENIGYGGMIHNFKNYLLRRNRSYLKETEQNLDECFSILNKLRKTTPYNSLEEKKIKVIKNTLLEYQSSLKTIKNTSKLSLKKLDSLVKVDDSKTLASFKWYTHMTKEEKKRSSLALSHNVERTKNSLILSVTLSTLFFLGTLFFIGIKLLKTQESLEQEKENTAHMARLYTLGQIAGNIAHEINNPLAILSGTSDILLKNTEKENPDPEITRRSCMTIKKTVDRISTVVLGLKNLTKKPDDSYFEKFNLNDTVSEVIALCKDRCNQYGISLTLDSNKNIFTFGQRTQIIQVVLNLVNNSIDAIKTKEEKWIKISTNQNKHFTEISITDSGIGLPKNIKEKLMEPFFTTKKNDSGTGIGLSISKNIIEKHGGVLSLDEHSVHTCFKIQIPNRDIKRV